MHDQWNSGSMRVYRLLVQDYHASRMHARWQHLIYFFTGCHHQHRAFNLRFSLHESFYRHFPLQEFFRFFSHQPVLYFSLLHPTNAFVLAVTVAVIKSSCFMLREVHQRIRDPFSLETKKTEINICLSVCCYGNFVLGTCRQ